MTVSDKLTPIDSGCIAALGTFDGVHCGHRQVIAMAHASGLPVVVVTSEQNPQKILQQQVKNRILSDKRCDDIFESLGVASVIRLDFCEIRNWTPEEYLDILCDGLNAKGFACGYDFRFGKGATGDVDTLNAYAQAHGLDALVCPPVEANGEVVSSTRIRQAVADGDMPLSARLLGAPYAIDGVVQHGDARGRKLGFPTINQSFGDDAVLPKFGVYASSVVIDGVAYRAVTNVGVRPTFRSPTAIAETHIIGFSGDVYAMRLSVQLHRFLREERRFESVQALTEQMTKDIDRAQQ